MPISVSAVLSIIVTIIAVILIYVKVMPEKNYHTLTPFLKKLADLFNFRKLWLESILKFFYVLFTVGYVVFGVFLILSVERYGGYYGSYSKSFFLEGLLCIVVGPIVLRLIYEGLMMSILLVKNVIQINNRLRDNGFKENDPAPEAVTPPVQPAPPVQPVQQPVPPMQQPVPPVYQPQKRCLNCGAIVNNVNSAYCPNCGRAL